MRVKAKTAGISRALSKKSSLFSEPKNEAFRAHTDFFMKL